MSYVVALAVKFVITKLVIERDSGNTCFAFACLKVFSAVAGRKLRFLVILFRFVGFLFSFVLLFFAYQLAAQGIKKVFLHPIHHLFCLGVTGSTNIFYALLDHTGDSHTE